MLYHIYTGTPRCEMNGFGFNIKLWPNWKEVVFKSDLTQEKIYTMIERRGRGWLDACEYDNTIDHGNGPEQLYKPDCIRISWGEWGLEHITVPGNACGLDLDRGVGAPIGGRVLSPRNIDCMRQAYLIQLVFNCIADYLVMEEEMRQMEK